MLSVTLTLIIPLIFYAASAFYLSVFFSDKAKAEKQAASDKAGKPKTEKKSAAASKKNKGKGSEPFKTLLVILLAEVSFFLLLTAVIKAFMFNGSKLPILPLAVTSALPFAAACCFFRFDNGKESRVYKLLRSASIFAAVLMALEVVIFNGKSLTQGTTDTVFKRDSFRTEGIPDDGVSDPTFINEGSVIIDDLPDGVKAVIVKMEQEERYDVYHESRPYICELLFQDDNFTQTYIPAQSKYVTTFDGECDFSLKPYGKLRSVKIHVNWLSNPVTIHEIRVLSAIPFSFIQARFFALLFVLTLISAVRVFGLHRITYSTRKRSHRIALDIMSILCACTAIFFYKPEMKSEKYVKELQPLGNPYAVQAAAFEEGQVSLLYNADPNMANVENIYSNDTRSASGVSYLWDYAYKDGKYYCYFGVSPTITLFYPVLHIKHKVLPIPKAIFIFSIFGMFFLCQTIIAAVKLLAPRANLLLLMLSMPTAIGSVGYYYILNYADMYCVPLACGLMYLALSLWLGFSAYLTHKKGRRLVMLTFSGIALALAVGSRPGMALGSVVLVPFFLKLLLDKKEKLSFRIGEASCFTVPLFIGAALLMWYNNVRFGSPLDFGAAYQLTVSDIHANSVSASGLPAAIYHYFFMPLRPRGVFPFFEQQSWGLNNYGSYAYIDYSIPVFTLPLIALGFLLLPMCFKKKNTCCCKGTTVLQRNAYYVLAICMALFIAWEDFCLGGVIQRYVIDVMTLMTLVAVPAILRVNVKPAKRRYLYNMTVICICTTFVLNWLLAISHRLGNIHLHNPGLQEKLEDMIIFWR